MDSTNEDGSAAATTDSEDSAHGEGSSTPTATPAAESGEPPEEAASPLAPAEPAEAQPPAAEAAETASTEQAEIVTLDGRIEGGWGYVGAAWGLSLAVLLVYVVVVNIRLRGYEAAERKP